jgi:hypothetical protein
MAAPPADLDLDRAWGVLRSVAVSSLDEAGLRALGAALVRVRGWLDGVDVACTRRAEALKTIGGAIDGRLFQREHGSRSERGARAAVERVGLLDAVPELAEALEAGQVGVGHADAIARVVATAEPEVRAGLLSSGSWLTQEARRSSVEELERTVRREARALSRADAGERLARQRQASNVRRWVDGDGMHHLHAELDPERGARVFSALDAALERVFHRAHPDGTRRAPSGGWANSRLAADALVELCTAPGSAAGSGAGTGELVVLIDYASLHLGIEQLDGICETASGVPLPVTTARRMLCDAAILPVVLGGDGQVLDAGSTRRLATRAQRRSLRAMYRTCGWPGCAVRFDHCEIHHTRTWRAHERTDLADLVPICGEHHHQIHDLGWHLALDDERAVTLYAPDGTIVEQRPFTPIGPCPSRPRRPDPHTQHVLRRLYALTQRE